MERIAAVIVTFNRKEKLRRCIEAVLRQIVSASPDIIVIDNNSSDGTGEMVRSISADNPGRIIYKRLSCNGGGAGGFSYGVREAVEAGYEKLWLMDDDCIPSVNALEEFMKFDREYNARIGGDGAACRGVSCGFLTGRVLWRDGSLCRMNIQRETVFHNISSQKLKALDSPCRVEMASFVSLFISAEIVKDVGLPLKEFYIWTDDWEYTRRISRRYPCWLVPSSEVVHDTECNTGADIASADTERTGRFRFLYRNDVYLYRREGIRGFMYETARLALHTARIAISRNSTAEKCRRLGIMYKATMEGLYFRPIPERITEKGF